MNHSFSIGQDELEQCPYVEEGDEIHCPTCDGRHTLEAATKQDGSKSTLLLFYRCGKAAYLGAIDHRALVPII